MTMTTEVRVPDIGDFKDVPVLQVLVREGMRVERETPLVILESEKSTIDIPSPMAGVVAEVSVHPGQKVSQGALILTLNDTGASASAQVGADGTPRRRPYASPAVRAMSRRLGVTLEAVPGTGPRGRILPGDVKAQAAQPQADGVPEAQVLDTAASMAETEFSRFGATARRPLSRVAQRAAANLARNWATIPHVTNFDEADVTALEEFRIAANAERAPEETKLTLLAFLIKVSAAALRRFPDFNASLDGQDLIVKHYCHVGFATDTPAGLLVPVIRDADTKGLRLIASEAAQRIEEARAGRLSLKNMEGGCFTVTSLGSIGGTGFTPIINAPEIAILGAARARIQPRWDGTKFVPRTILPLSLSWDHRAASGAPAARFLSFITEQLSELRRLLL
jgi:pyruvate dehydrogenase E2 component (dihydrolipoamide acetyltransferase)